MANEASQGAAGGLLFVSAGLSPRGGGIATAGRLMLDATRAWAAKHDVRLRLLTLGGADEIPAGVEGEAFDGDRLRMARAVWRAQRMEGFTHHVYDFLGLARIQGVLPRAFQARFLLYVYGIECWRPLRGTRRRAVTGAAVRLASSRDTVARMRAHNPWAPEIRVLHLALPDESVDGEPDAPLLDAIGQGFVLIVGRLASGERYKGHDELLAAVAQLVPAHPDIRLVIAGEGDDRPRLEARARELAIADRVQFTGFVSAATLRALYERCAMLAMPSTGEGFGFVYLEAMRAGKPCIALRGTAPAEIVVDGETGLLVEPGVRPLASALDTLLRGPARAQAMGAAGRVLCEERFRPERFASDFARELDALMLPREADRPIIATSEATKQSIVAPSLTPDLASAAPRDPSAR